MVIAKSKWLPISPAQTKPHRIGKKPALAPLSWPEALSASPTPSNTREKILYAAMGVLNNEGFGALTQTRVADLAGVRQSHLTYYFPTRNDLLRETAVYGCNAMLSAVAMGIESGVLNLENFRDVISTDIHDRRFARLMCALIVASDEDDRIKPWLASFEAANVERLQQNLHRLGLIVTLDEVAFFHATFVGAAILDLGESTDDSLKRAKRKISMAFDAITAAARLRSASKASAKLTRLRSAAKRSNK
jgi:AcrR family transcriptional regulator